MPSNWRTAPGRFETPGRQYPAWYDDDDEVDDLDDEIQDDDFCEGAVADRRGAFNNPKLRPQRTLTTKRTR